MTVDVFSIFIYIIAAICVVRGFWQGMMKMVISVLEVILTIVLVSSFAPDMEQILLGYEPIYDRVQETSQEYLTQILTEDSTLELEEQAAVIESLPMPEEIRDILLSNNHAGSYEELLVNTFAEYLSISITNMIIKILAYVLTFLLIGLAVRIIAGVILGIVRLPGLRLLNTVGGGALGILQAVIVIWLIFLIVTIFYGNDWGKACYEIIRENVVFEILYDHNLFLHFISGIK